MSSSFLPEPLLLFSSLVLGAIGTGLFVYGKKQERFPSLIAGILLIVFPYFVNSLLGIWSGAALIGLGLWAALRAGW